MEWSNLVHSHMLQFVFVCLSVCLSASPFVRPMLSVCVWAFLCHMVRLPIYLLCRKNNQSLISSTVSDGERVQYNTSSGRLLWKTTRGLLWMATARTGFIWTETEVENEPTPAIKVSLSSESRKFSLTVPLALPTYWSSAIFPFWSADTSKVLFIPPVKETKMTNKRKCEPQITHWYMIGRMTGRRGTHHKSSTLHQTMHS